jgi:hypothetical protein
MATETTKEYVDELAQDIINVWGVYNAAGCLSDLSPECKVLIDLADRYRRTTRLTDERRRGSVLTADLARDEITTMQELIQGDVAFRRKFGLPAPRHTAKAHGNKT